jgi:hypothetical protein
MDVTTITCELTSEAILFDKRPYRHDSATSATRKLCGCFRIARDPPGTRNVGISPINPERSLSDLMIFANREALGFQQL